MKILMIHKSKFPSDDLVLPNASPRPKKMHGMLHLFHTTFMALAHEWRCMFKSSFFSCCIISSKDARTDTFLILGLSRTPLRKQVSVGTLQNGNLRHSFFEDRFPIEPLGNSVPVRILYTSYVTFIYNIHTIVR